MDDLPTEAGLDAWLSGYAACARYSDPSVCGEIALFTLILRWLRQNPGVLIPTLDAYRMVGLLGAADGVGKREVLRTMLRTLDAIPADSLEAAP